MVVLRPESVAAQHTRKLLRRAPRARVDDRRAAAQGVEPLDEDRDAVLGVRDLLDVVPEVRPHDARVDDLERPPERVTDLACHRGCRGGRHPEERRLAELGQRAVNEEVVRPEVVPPHAHAVHLVDDDEADADLGEHGDESRLAQALRRRVDEPRLSGRDGGEPRGALLR